MPPSLNIAVVGAGPVGLALALQAAQLLPGARISLFDARPADKDIAGDPRTLALAIGSIQLLQRLGTWPAALAQPITEVHVSQAPPSLADPRRARGVALIMLAVGAIYPLTGVTMVANCTSRPVLR